MADYAVGSNRYPTWRAPTMSPHISPSGLSWSKKFRFWWHKHCALIYLHHFQKYSDIYFNTMEILFRFCGRCKKKVGAVVRNVLLGRTLATPWFHCDVDGSLPRFASRINEMFGLLIQKLSGMIYFNYL
ncbi:hypothetical protein TNIN_294461 [Trichonephila inaurata madagascariensis]|uniref:Uncharacterized protein n=1 Tax=Trichonephila inaurata madagascariensis TaxID=2747483 RepID=A0A8X6X635_9ARAC|nr:hypothetical protein TNIN_294461 [Trichonephila inaurata madagascariensis]